MNKYKMEVGDLVVHPTYEGKLVEAVSYVGTEGVVLNVLFGGVVGMNERYAKFSALSDGWYDIYHRRNEDTYRDFLANIREKVK